MEARCIVCSGRGICDHADWVMDKDNTVHVVATDVEDCPDFVLNNDYISEDLAKEIMLLDPGMYDKVQVQFSLPENLHARIFLTKNILDQAEQIKELREEVTEMLENYVQQVMTIKDLNIVLDFAFESESDPKVPNCLPDDIHLVQSGKCSLNEEEEDPDWGDVRDEDGEWDEDEDEDEEWKGEQDE